MNQPLPPSQSPLLVTPIGYIYTEFVSKFDAPHQPQNRGARANRIELLPHSLFEQALEDLEGFERIWIVWWFHKNQTWKPKVLPPRGANQKRGVFATRSPHRPNPIGITSVELLKIEGRTIYVGDVDLLDQTPILDIKPYLPEVDALPDSKIGWLTSVQEALVSEARHPIECSPLVLAQAEWLKSVWNIDFLSRAREILSMDPSPHRTRRISRVKGEYRMGCGPWRLFFGLNDGLVFISRIAPGYPYARLVDATMTAIHDREAQLQFLERWPEMK